MTFIEYLYLKRRCVYVCVYEDDDLWQVTII